MNAKLLSPLEVVEACVDYWEEHQEQIDISQIEGFVRQIIGWREFMRGIYWAKMPEYATLNYFEHKAPLPDWYWTGDTKMKCLHTAVNQSLDHAYAHHIQRLMVTGNFALLLGVDPDELDQWYLGIYMDAIEWVEITNTRGMSQFADGGIVGTKPYVASANYMHKMSDHCTNCAYDRKKKVGKDACPFNSLYWDFYDRHTDKLGNNPRIGMMYRIWNKMDSEQQEAILKRAEYIKVHINDF
jgi:deoxyribodipyrimidine photolyase-related protein